MKAVILRAYGAPDVLKYQEVPDPRISPRSGYRRKSCCLDDIHAVWNVYQINSLHGAHCGVGLGSVGAQLADLALSANGKGTVLVTGAIGNVGRSAVYRAKQRGAVVLAGVLRRRIEEAETIGADDVIALDDESSLQSVPSTQSSLRIHASQACAEDAAEDG